MPRGRRPSTAALTRLGARKASEMVILTCRTLHFSRVQSSATVVTRPETTSSSQRRPRAIALTSRARRSNCSGRTSLRDAFRGRRIWRDLLEELCEVAATPYARSADRRLVLSGGEMLLQGFHDDVFDVGCGDAGDRSGGRGLCLSMQERRRYVVSIADACFCGVGCDHAMAGIVEQQSCQEVVGLIAYDGTVGPLGERFLPD